VWKIEVAVGGQADAGDDLIIVESMKMEIPVVTDSECVVNEIRCSEGDAVTEGQVLLVVDP
jgi:acetyl-CoA carboxylase biotin carboxyl carrier protein